MVSSGLAVGVSSKVVIATRNVLTANSTGHSLPHPGLWVISVNDDRLLKPEWKQQLLSWLRLRVECRRDGAGPWLEISSTSLSLGLNAITATACDCWL
jgi:hypothetical protein